MCAALADYRERHGDCRVPNRWPENERLATWVVRTRKYRRANRVTPAQVRQLDGLGFVWESEYTDRWERMYAALVAYRRRHGHCRVSTLSPTDSKLGNWVRTQRGMHRKGTLDPERFRRLDRLGFTWDARAK
jgi:hypothetical protein